MSEPTGTTGSEHTGTATSREIQLLLRNGRQSKGLTQAQVAQLVDSSRFTINRLEMGSLELNASLARRLEDALELTGLSALVARREQARTTPTVERDEVVRALLGRPELERVTIVVADDLDVYEIMYNERRDAPLAARDIRVMFPSVAREGELFGSGRPLYGWVEYQLKRLAELQATERFPGDSLRLYESDRVISSCVVTSTRTSTECAYWSPVPVDGRVRGEGLPVVTSADPATTGRIEAYAEGLYRDVDPLRTNRAVCKVSAPPEPAATQPATAGGPSATFTGYFGQGVDQEEAVRESEGFAVALVLTVANCDRRDYELGRRAVVYKRLTATRDRRRLSLFSSNVEDADIRAARAVVEKQERETARSTRSALAAGLEIQAFLELAAEGDSRPGFSDRGRPRVRDVRPRHRSGAFWPEELPSQLQLIRKAAAPGQPRRAAVAPRLYVLELQDTPRPELEALRFAADIEELGTADMAENDRLNDFLLAARDCGFLAPLLQRLKIEER